MPDSKSSSWPSMLAVLLLLGAVLLLGWLTHAQSAGSTTGASEVSLGKAGLPPASTSLSSEAAPSQATAVSQSAIPKSIPPNLLSPEQVMEAVQQSGLANGDVSSIDLTADANGRPVYRVGTGGPNAGFVDVDAVTGKLIPAKP
jgi:hypothetical protein